MSDNNDVERIKEALSLDRLVSRYVRLEPSGVGRFKARCPFHNEKTPSFFVDADKGMFYCFGCGKGGDIFTFVQEIEGIGFGDAIKMLADIAGVKLTGSAGRSSGEKGRLLDAVELACRVYEKLLWDESNKDVVEYLRGRGLSDETIRKFRIGYSVNKWDVVSRFLVGKGFRESQLIEAGLAFRSKRGGLIDFFRERIMFPILDVQGRPIGFTARIFTKEGSSTDVDKVGKYVNSREGKLFDKSSVLLNLSNARRAIVRNKRAVVVEGVMDVIALYEAGVEEAVGVLGTALTSKHADLLSRYTNNVVLLFDGDSAGINATKRSAVNLFGAGLYVDVGILPDGLDPSDVLNRDKGELVEIVNKPVNYFEFVLRGIGDVVSSQEKAEVLSSGVFPALFAIQSPIYFNEMVGLVADILGVADNVLLSEFENWKSKNRLGVEGVMESNVVKKGALRSAKNLLIAVRLFCDDEGVCEVIDNEIGGDVDLGSLNKNTYFGLYAELEKGVNGRDWSMVVDELIVDYNIEKLEREKRMLEESLKSENADPVDVLSKISNIVKKIDKLKTSKIIDII